MSSKLEIFIKENRGQMDDVVPSEELWAGVSAGIVGGSLLYFFKSKLVWLKFFGFGASLVAITTAGYFYLSDGSQGKENSGAKKINITEKMEPPKDLQEFIPVLDEGDSTKKKITKANKSPKKVPDENLQNLPVTETSKDTVAMQQALTSSIAPVALSQTSVTKISANSSGTTYSVTDSGRNKNITVSSKDTILKDVETLVLISCCADVNISGYEKDEVHLKANFSSEKKGIVRAGEYKLNFLRSGKTLTISLQNVKKSEVIIGSLNLNNVINLEVPKNVEIIATTAMGDITAKGLRGKNYSFTSSSGDVKMQDMEADIKISSAHGDVNLKKISGKIELKVTSGDMEANDLNGSFACTNAFGNTTFENLKGDLKLTSSSGDVLIKNSEASVKITSAHGNIHFENYKGSPFLIANSGDISGKNMLVTEKLNAKTAFGNINLQLSNPLKDLSIHAKSTNGLITVDKDGEKTKINGTYKMNIGKILIQCETVSGDQYYK